MTPSDTLAPAFAPPLAPAKETPAAAVSIRGLNKTYASGFTALADVDLDIAKGEIFALLGPNGAGKTTLIGSVCGLVRPTAGVIRVEGHDIAKNFRAARAAIGLVPQEMSTDLFETVWNTTNFSRGLFGKPANPALVEKVLKDLSLWDKRSAKIMTLSGGMKRRVMIAKALAHEPSVLFLDEPTAGVDVELRRDMWTLVRGLKASGVTIILTTHYIEEAEEMADRIGVIDKGRIILVEEKAAMMQKLGKRELKLMLAAPLAAPPDLPGFDLHLAEDGWALIYSFDAAATGAGVAALLRRLNEIGLEFKDLSMRESSLEEIFVNLVKGAGR